MKKLYHLLALASMLGPLQAQIRLPRIIASNMVLQQQSHISLLVLMVVSLLLERILFKLHKLLLMYNITA